MGPLATFFCSSGQVRKEAAKVINMCVWDVADRVSSKIIKNKIIINLTSLFMIIK